jgi:hypothetical protein
MTDHAARHISREGLAALEFYRDGLGLDTRGVVAPEFTGAVSRAPRHRLDPYSRTVGISSVE